MPMPARTRTHDMLKALVDEMPESLNRGVDSCAHTECDVGVMNMTLTTLNSPTRSPFLLPRPLFSTPSAAILPIRDLKAYSSSHNVPIVDHLSAAPTLNVSSTTTNSQNVSLNTSSSIPFRVPDLAAQHGIPVILPKAPNTAPRRTSSATPPTTSSPSVDFSTIRSNYLKMLAPKPTSASTPAAVDTMQHNPEHTPEQRAAVEFFESVIGDTSPLFSDAGDDFLTGETTPALSFFDSSPFDTPYNDFLTTPLFQDEPLITDDFDSMNLFGAVDMDFSQTKAPQSFNLESLYTLPSTSPALGSIDPAATALYPSPRVPSEQTFPSTSSQRVPTGTRKNLTPDTMVPIDAPTQPRQYRTPSATSRKELPATFARKRGRAEAFAEEDELELEDLGPNATEAEQIEHKRRQNTIAARKSRKRKLEYQQGLESKVDQLKVELEQWRVRAEIYEGVLRSHGLGAAALPPM